MHEREVELAFPGQRVAAEGHGDLLHLDAKSSRRERLDKDVGRPTDSSKRGRAVGRHRADERQRCLVRAEERANDAAAVAADKGLPADAPRPEIDPTKGTLDHFAINLKHYDPEAVTEYLTAAGHAPYAQGRRYGADGDGYSIYLTDPEGTVVELKSGN